MPLLCRQAEIVSAERLEEADTAQGVNQGTPPMEKEVNVRLSAIRPRRRRSTAGRPPAGRPTGRSACTGPRDRSRADRGTRHRLASTKGGVGKSTVAANLALAMQRLNQRIGLLDADVTGRVSHDAGISGRPRVSKDKRIYRWRYRSSGDVPGLLPR